MATYKQFNSQDIIVSPLEVNKSFTFAGDALTGSNVNIDRFIAKPGDFLTDQTQTGQISGSQQYEVLVYDSIKQLYYSNYISGSYGDISNANTASFNTDGTITGPVYQTNFYNYEQTTLNPYKFFPTGANAEVGIVSIPSKLYGDYIQPNSIKLESPTLLSTIYDNGEGILYYTSGGQDYFIGNIIYQHGILVLNDNIVLESLNTFITSSNVTCSFSSSYTIYETQYKCEIGESEFNFTLNPSILSGSEGDLYNQFTGSYFDPYITTVGMYNENFELLAVGKLAKPLPTSRTTDTTILINIDR